EEVPHVVRHRVGNREDAPAWLPRADRDGERSVLRDTTARLHRYRLRVQHRVATAERAVDVVEPGVRTGRPIRVRERVRIEPRQRDEHDSDAEEDDDPPECPW